jgi:hypothetical protein
MGGGKGGETTVTETTQVSQVDPEAARRMAAVAERSQQLAEQQWGTYQNIFAPYEQELVSTNRAVLPYYQQMMEAEYGAQARLAAPREEATRLGLEEQIRDIEMGRPVKEALVQQQLAELEQAAPVSAEFYRQALEGVDVGQRMAEAQADIEQGYAGTRGIMSRELARAGVMPGSARQAEALEDLLYQRAKSIGGARTLARRGAETESFGRLQTAMGVRGRATGLPGVESTAAGATSATPYQTAATQLGGYTLQNAADRAAQLYGQAIQANVPGMAKYNTGTTQTTSGGNDFWGFAGTALGYGAGAYTGGLGYGLAQKTLY